MQVNISKQAIATRRYFLGYPITSRRVPCEQVIKLSIKEGSKTSSGHRTTVYYSLLAHRNDGSTCIIAERMHSRPELELIKGSVEMYLPNSG